MISQIAIMILGASAIWLVGRKEEWKRWGYIVGLLGQPFWFYTCYTNEQWGIFIMCFFYTYSWGQGIWNYWIVPKRNNPKNTSKDIIKIVDQSIYEFLSTGKTYLYNGRTKNKIPHLETLQIFKSRIQNEHPNSKFTSEYGEFFGVWCYKIETHNL